MKKRTLAAIIAVLVVVAGVAISTILSNQKQPMQRRSGNGVVREVPLLTVRNGDVPAPVVVSGPLAAYDRVDLYAEVSGVLANAPKPFRAGTRFDKDEVMLRLDDRVYRHNVRAQKSLFMNRLTQLLPDFAIDFPDRAAAWEEYLKQTDPDRPLVPLPEARSDKERFYLASRDIYNLFHTIRGMEVTLGKYTLRAPFNGVVALASLNPGTLVRAGQKLGEFAGTRRFEVDASLPAFDAGRLSPGMVVSLAADARPGDFEGRVARIGGVIDPETMSVRVFVTTSAPGLRDGMYVTGRVESSRPVPDAVAVSKDLLVGTRSLYVVRQGVLQLQTVIVAGHVGDRVILRGLADGTVILAQPWPEARPGARVPGADGNSAGEGR